MSVQLYSHTSSLLEDKCILYSKLGCVREHIVSFPLNDLDYSLHICNSKTCMNYY